MKMEGPKALSNIEYPVLEVRKYFLEDIKTEKFLSNTKNSQDGRNSHQIIQIH